MKFQRIILRSLSAALSVIPSIVLAEVSDKLPSLVMVVTLGIFLGIGFFLLTMYRWWFSLVLLPVFFVLVSENVNLWNEEPIREAILKEQGWIYFAILFARDALIMAALIGGAIIGKGRSQKLHSPRRWGDARNPDAW